MLQAEQYAIELFLIYNILYNLIVFAVLHGDQKINDTTIRPFISHYVVFNM